MKSIGICIVINAPFSFVKTCIDNAIRALNGANVRFYIFDNASIDSRTSDYCKAVCESFAKTENPIKKQYFEETHKPIQDSLAYNKLFQRVEEDFICVLPIDVIVNDNWAIDLLNAIESVHSSGVVGIRTGEDKTQLSFALSIPENAYSTESMRPVWQPQEFAIVGVFLMRTNVVRIIGGYDEFLFGAGYERDEMCYRFKANGYVNFYVFGQNSVATNGAPFKNTNHNELYLSRIAQMNKSQIFKKQF